MGAGGTYLDTLLLYYEEELEGEAYFAQLARAFPEGDHRQKLGLLAQVERHAAGAVAPLIRKYRLAPRPIAELRADGQKAARDSAAHWPALLAEMKETYPGYVRDFERLEDMGPPEDRQRLSFLTQHEVAALAFLALEATQPDQSAEPLHAYLAQAPETWGLS